MPHSPDELRTRPRVPTRLPYLPALDGLRAIALLAVLAFHAGVSQVRGGYLPLTAFFVLSGFLITSLLLIERRNHGRIDLPAFWGRRVRRLAPAAVLGLGMVGLYVAFAARTQIEGLVGDVVGALTWVTNWRFIATGRVYADVFSDPSPLQHYWSLAVEEQFYLVLPLLAAGLLYAGRGRRRVFAGVCVGLIAASVLVMRAVYVPGGAPLRAYFGTDSRGAELLVGVLLAIVMITPDGALRRFGDRTATVVNAAGALALAGSVWLWLVIPEYDRRLYAGGLLGIAVLAALVVMAGTQPRTVVSRVLGWRPLVVVGRMSYGAYLYHWPLFLWVDAEMTGLDVWPLFALRMAIVMPVAWLSYRFIETPLRTMQWQPRIASLGWANAAVGVTAAIALLAAGLPSNGISLSVAERAVASPSSPAAPARPTLASTGDPANVEGSDLPEPSPSAVAVSASPTTTPVPTAPSSSPSGRPPATVAPTSPPSPTPPPALRVLVVGDSLAFNLATGLQRDADAGGAVVVDDESIPGCTITRGGVRRIESGTWLVDARCSWWARSGASKVAAFRPDVVLINSSVNEIFDRRRPEWGDDAFRSPGDPQFDRFVTDEWAAATDVFLAAGARVVWVRPTCVDFARYQQGYIGPDEGDRREAYFRDTLFGKLVSSRPIGVADLNSQVCPGNRYTPDVFGVAGGRPDGFHFTDATSEVIAREWLVPRLRQLVESEPG